MKNIKKSFTSYNSMFQRCFNQWKTWNHFFLNVKRTILKKINISFIVHFSLGKYSFRVETLWIYLNLTQKHYKIAFMSYTLLKPDPKILPHLPCHHLWYCSNFIINNIFIKSNGEANHDMFRWSLPFLNKVQWKMYNAHDSTPW